LQEGDEATRLAATEAVGALGAVEAIKPLYNTLRDQHPEIRDAAHRALANISRAAGQPLPGVVSAPVLS
jgi:HEAT repeat protein